LYHLPGSLESGFQWSCVVSLIEHLCWQSLTHDIFLILIRFMWASVAKALDDCRCSGDVNRNPVSWPLWSMRYEFFSISLSPFLLSKAVLIWRLDFGWLPTHASVQQVTI
jgi:hypothetical protein